MECVHALRAPIASVRKEAKINKYQHNLPKNNDPSLKLTMQIV